MSKIRQFVFDQKDLEDMIKEHIKATTGGTAFDFDWEVAYDYNDGASFDQLIVWTVDTSSIT